MARVDPSPEPATGSPIRVLPLVVSGDPALRLYLVITDGEGRSRPVSTDTRIENYYCQTSPGTTPTVSPSSAEQWSKRDPP